MWIQRKPMKAEMKDCQSHSIVKEAKSIIFEAIF